MISAISRITEDSSANQRMISTTIDCWAHNSTRALREASKASLRSFGLVSMSDVVSPSLKQKQIAGETMSLKLDLQQPLHLNPHLQSLLPHPTRWFKIAQLLRMCCLGAHLILHCSILTGRSNSRMISTC